MSDTIRIGYHEGTLILTGAAPAVLEAMPGVWADPRTKEYRAEGRAYRALVEYLRRQGIAYSDEARHWGVTPWPLRIRICNKLPD